MKKQEEMMSETVFEQKSIPIVTASHELLCSQVCLFDVFGGESHIERFLNFRMYAQVLAAVLRAPFK